MFIRVLLSSFTFLFFPLLRFMFGSQVVVVGVSEIDGGELLCLVHNGGEWQFVDVSVL